MKQLIPALVFTLCAAAAAANPAQPVDPGLLAMARSADQAWNQRDAQAMAAHYSEDATASIGGIHLTGKSAIHEYFTNSLGKLPAGLTHRTEVRRIERIGDLVAADNAVYLETENADNGKRVVREFFTVTLLRKAGTGWQFVAVRSAPVRGELGNVQK